MRKFAVISFVIGSVLSAALAAPVGAQDPSPSPPPSPPAAPSGQDLAKQLANPVADLISVPFQSNWENGVGPGEETRYILNFQPVLPFSISKDWNVISRTIVPFVGQPVLFEGGAPATGIADMLESLFFSPKQSKVVWGVGPVFSLPTNTEPTLGSGKFGLGPTFVVLKQTGPWTLALLANHVWSVSGPETRADVSQTFIQPILGYTTKSAWTVTLQSESTINWEADSGQRATVPINLIVSKVTKLGRNPVSLALGAGYFVESPTGGPEWKVRAILTLLFPVRRPPAPAK